MLHQILLRRTVQVAACAAVLLLNVTIGEGAPRRARRGPAAGGGGGGGNPACINTYRNADALYKSGKLRQAKATMLRCAVATCGPNVRRECARRVITIENDIPTIVPIILSEAGKAVTDVTMLLDGEVLKAKTDGRAVPVDPGRHLLSFRSGSDVLASFETVFVQGQRNRTIEVSLQAGGNALAKSSIPLTAAAPPPADPLESVGAASSASGSSESSRASESSEASESTESSSSAELSPASLVRPAVDPDEEPPEAPPDQSGRTGSRQITLTSMLLAGGGVLAVGGFFVGTAIANGGTERLDSCRPNCAQKRVDRIRQIYLGSRVLLGLGAASIIGAGVLYYFSDSGSAMALGRSGYALGVAPSGAGGVAVFSGAF